MLILLSIIFHYAVTAADPSWTCTLTHRDPDIAGTYYFYCSQLNTDGIELIQVGSFISDARAVVSEIER